MPKKKKTVNSKDIYKDRFSRSGESVLSAASAISSGGTRIQLPPGEPDLDALRSVTREWLVPRLVEKFLRVHGVESKHVGSLVNRLQPSLLGAGPLVPGSAGSISKEIGSQVKRKANTRTLGKGGHGKGTPRP